MSDVDSSDAKEVGNKNSGTSKVQTLSRWVLGVALLLAGMGHLRWARTEFLAQVPPWVPLEGDLVVVLSGIVEIVLGGALIALPKYRVALGWITAVFFVLFSRATSHNTSIKSTPLVWTPISNAGSGCCSSRFL